MYCVAQARVPIENDGVVERETQEDVEDLIVEVTAAAITMDRNLDGLCCAEVGACDAAGQLETVVETPIADSGATTGMLVLTHSRPFSSSCLLVTVVRLPMATQD